MLKADSAPGARAEWHASRTEKLCTRGSRFVTGADIVRISRTLALEPWHLTQTAPAAADDPTGIVTEGSRRRVNLRLANGRYGCLFLLRTAGGLGRCGLGDLAPASCRAFPAKLGERAPAAPSGPEDKSEGTAEGKSEGTAAEGKSEGTAEGKSEQLTMDGLDVEMLAEVERGWIEDRDHWFEVVKRWNAQSDEYPSGDEADIHVFQRYLLEAHAAREAGTSWPGEV
ncbi:hypothetical protein M2271_006102 [Streptomyces sp. LBL]|uniref:hypothetical protein n=1 Tax=Streptomyces sp. LBL TaxID=2940562 RepID=UPI0024746B75|nr:hypothetical protein [Streptomyces sp. LBL]MDH6628270.1 hypothetical protein [Streptomyces sp. LBL]